MRITKVDSSAQTPTVRPRSEPGAVLLIALLLLAFGLGFAAHQGGWYRPLETIAVSFARRPALTAASLLRRSDLPTLTLDVKLARYLELVDRRDQALRTGANAVSAQDFVSATITGPDGPVPIWLRLAAGPATGLAGARWPLEAVSRQDATLFGQRAFTLTPADAGTLSTWGYLETLRRAGLLASPYRLVLLTLNGSSKGLYAEEAHPSSAWLAAPGRPEVAVVYFDAAAYWEAWAWQTVAPTGDGFPTARAAVDCPATEAAASAVCLDALRALQALQSGTLAPSAVLDVDETAKFLALTTLWRGSPELDWRSLYLAYDPTTARLTPIGTGSRPLPAAPLPPSLLDDPQLQVAVGRALAQYSSPDYLAQLQAELGADLETVEWDLWPDLGDVADPWTALEAHQAAMRRQLAPERTLLASVETADESALVLRLTNVLPFPVQVASLEVGEAGLLPIDPAWVDESDRALLVDGVEAVVLRAAAAPRPVHLRVPLAALPAGYGQDGLAADPLRVVTSLYLLAGEQVVVAVQAEAEGGGTP